MRYYLYVVSSRSIVFYSIEICRVALRYRAACQLTVNSYANMATGAVTAGISISSHSRVANCDCEMSKL